MNDQEPVDPEHAEIGRLLRGAQAQVQPPPAFRATIMRGVEAAAARLPRWRRWRRTWRARRFDGLAATFGVVPAATSTTMSWQGGRPAARKLLWAVAGVASVGVVLVWFTGYPDVESGAEGTIGAATRTGARPAGRANVEPGRTAAQAFLQSDLFEGLLVDRDAVRLLCQAPVRKALADRGFVSRLQQAASRRTVGERHQLDEASLGALAPAGNPELLAAMSRPEFAAGLRSPAFVAALGSPGFADAVSWPQFASRVEAASREIDGARE